ncbi:MAG: hypothetical protein JKY82_01885 [Rhizobiaceae bacterium]|nr:hypothetical protein [Rhizobiaceae bacterium]
MENEASDYAIDAEELSATALKAKYLATYNSWKNMKSRRKIGAIINDEFMDFPDFLCAMGPRPSKEYTIDRIDPDDPEYSIDKCRWLDKKGQSSNRGATIKMEYKGKLVPLVEVAKAIGEKPDTLRRRHNKGWSDSEIIHGRTRARGNAPWSRAFRIEEFPITARWPWLSVKSAEQWEIWYSEDHNFSTSRHDYFQDETNRNLEKVKVELSLLFDIKLEKLHGQQISRNLLEAMDRADIAIDDVDERSVFLTKLRARLRAVLKKANKYKDMNGPFHSIPKPEIEEWVD